MASATKDSTPVRTPTTSSSTLPAKSPHHQRTHSVGSMASHRITRRKSMSSGTNIAAVAQAVKEAADAPFSLAAVAGSNVIGKLNGKSTEGADAHGYPSPPSSLPTPGPLGAATGNTGPVIGIPLTNKKALLTGSAIADGNAPDVNRPSRSRRASEGAGATMVTGGLKASRGRSGSELKCDKCGKGYKHSSCLTKHLWEHTPEWSYTSKLLISKHQQVQLLEAASILVAMNPTPPASSSGASNNEGNSSATDSSSSDETTPPPPGQGLASPVPTPRGIRNGAGKPGKRYSSGSFTRSLQSSSGFLAAGSAPGAPAFPNHLPARPSGRSRAGSSVSTVRGSLGAPSPMLNPAQMSEDEALAAAVELLSCSFNTGTPVMGPTIPIGSIPRGAMSDIGSPPAGGRSYMGPLGDVVEMKQEESEGEEEERDVEMDEEDSERWSRTLRGRSEEDEDGVFGHMEE